MKYVKQLAVAVMTMLTFGCNGINATATEALSTPSAMPTSTVGATMTSLPPLPTVSAASSESAIPTAVETATAIASSTVPQSAASLTPKCLNVMPAFPKESASSGVVILESQVIIGGRQKPETYLVNLTTGATVTVTNGAGFSVTPDRKLLAYENAVRDQQDRILKDDLVISDASGRPLRVIPWESAWLDWLGWLDNQRVALTQLEPGQRPVSLQLINPFTSQRQLLHPDFPEIVSSPIAKLPFWQGWYGILYDPTLTRAIYPRFVQSGHQQLTYALWDVSKQQLVASLENSFAVPAQDNDIYPMPEWSADGSQFVFRGLVDVSPQLAKFELYRVTRDGQVEQLTNLTSIALVQDSNLSWSPDGRYIAMLLNDWQVYEQHARVAILDTTNLEITDFCFMVNYGQGLKPLRPVWSLDSKQFLVADRGVADKPRVILVDIVKGLAGQIAEDEEPDGWMAAAP